MTYYTTQLFIELYRWKNLLKITDITQIILHVGKVLGSLFYLTFTYEKRYKYFFQINNFTSLHLC